MVWSYSGQYSRLWSWNSHVHIVVRSIQIQKIDTVDISRCQKIKDAEVHIQHWRQICGARLSIINDGSVYIHWGNYHCSRWINCGQLSLPLCCNSSGGSHSISVLRSFLSKNVCDSHTDVDIRNSRNVDIRRHLISYLLRKRLWMPPDGSKFMPCNPYPIA